MKRIYQLLFFFAFLFVITCGNFLSAQITLQGIVHFKKDRSALTDDEVEILHALADTIQTADVERILIKGYTDSDADSIYNAKLSLNRCNTVRAFFISAGFDSSSCHIAAFGEYFPIVANADESGKSKNRRVEIFITMKPPIPVKPCTGDTMIELSDGVFMAMSKCFPDGGTCIHPTVTRREEHDLKRGIFRKLINPKNPYKKNSMHVSYYVNLNCDKGISCSGSKVTLYAPMYEVKGKDILVQQYDSATAEIKTVNSTKIKTIKKKKYGTTETTCPGKPSVYTIFRCGTRNNGSACNCEPVKLVLKKGMKADSAVSYCGSKTEINGDSSEVSFYGSFGLNYLIVEYNNDTIHLQNIELTALHHGMKRVKACGKKKIGLHLGKRNKCAFYRKYKFRKSDIDLQKRKPWTMNQLNNSH